MTPLWLFLVTWLAMTSQSLSQNIDCANPADIIFLMDGSDSIDVQEWNQERSFVARMINNLDISIDTINVGFTVYSSKVDSEFGLTPFRPKIVLTARARTLEHPTGIATNTAAGIASTIETFNRQPPARSNAPKILIVITDGSSENPAETIRQAQLAKQQGIRIITVGVGNNVFHEELQQIASNPSKYYRTPDFNALQGIESEIRNMICRVITTTQSPRFTFAPPTRPPEVIPVASDQICNNSADIVFVIDGSDSISDADFIRLKNFVANLIDNFEIGKEAIHVGMVVYSSLIGDKIGLFPPHSKLLLKFFANNLRHPKFGTDTAAGIEAGVNMIKEQGRANAPAMIVVITDGRSVNPRNTFVQASIAKAQDITMIAIGVGRDIFSEELQNIASGPGYVSEVADFTSLANTVNVMRNLICTSIVTTTTTMMPPTPPPSIDPPKKGIICSVPGDVAILLDGSDSIKPNDWIKQINFVANLINNLEVGKPYIHVGVVVYSTTIGDRIDLEPFNPKPVLVQRVKGLYQPRFGTDTALGIKTVHEMFKLQGRPNAPRVAIVVTDGKSTHPDNTFIQASLAKANGVTMISVGVGSDIFDDELVNIASSPGQVFRVADFASLKKIIGTLRDSICQVVQTTTLPPETTTTPMTTTTVMPTPQPVPLVPCVESRTEAELVFLMDASRTMTPYNWMMETHLVSNFLDGVDIQKNFMHVGVVVSDNVRADSVSIMPFKNRYHLKELVQGFKHPSGDMDLATGLRKVRDMLREGRREAQRLVVVLTDVNSKQVDNTIKEAAYLLSEGVDIVSMGVGDTVNMAELRTIATKPEYSIKARNFQEAFQLLPTLQNVVCEILRKPETTTMTPSTTPKPSLCDGCLIDKGVGFNPYPGDCTKYVQCWRVGEEVRALVRSCPFGQFWDADAITCRPSFLVRCTADPCRYSEAGFTYGMAEYGCKAYWKCLDGFSVGHCCPSDSKYVEGIGCLAGAVCKDDCPPAGGIAVKPVCDKKPHWDKRFYIQIIYARGEIVRPCPVGTIFFEDRCSCDFGMSGLLPANPDVRCQPAAFFNFDVDMLDKSANGINVGITQLRLTDLGTAYFNGRSEMNLWRFAGADWGSQLVIKFKFRFDYSNKFIDYGGLPVDLDLDFDVNMNLISDYEMTNLDWRIWNQLRNVQSLQDWQTLLREFGQARTFYIFLGQLGFKPGTFNSLQVMRILGTPKAYQEFQVLLQKLRQASKDLDRRGGNGAASLKSILAQLRSMRGYINWNNIVNTGSSGTGETVVTQDGHTVPPMGGSSWKWDGSTGRWVEVSGGIEIPLPTTGPDGNILNMGGIDVASEWKWNAQTGQWERLAAVNTGGGVASGGSQVTSGSHWHTGGAFATGGGNTAGAGGAAVGSLSWEDLLREMQKVQNSSTAGSWAWDTSSSVQGGGGLTGNQAAIEALLRQLKLAEGQQGSASWSWNLRNGTSSGTKLDTRQLQDILNQLQKSANGNGQHVGSGWGGAFNLTSSFVTSGGRPVLITGGMGSNTGISTSESKRTIEVRQDTQNPTDNVSGGRLVGGSFRATSSSNSGQGSGGQTGGLSGGQQFTSGSQIGGHSGGQQFTSGGSDQSGGMFFQETSSRVSQNNAQANGGDLSGSFNGGALSSKVNGGDMSGRFDGGDLSGSFNAQFTSGQTGSGNAQGQGGWGSNVRDTGGRASIVTQTVQLPSGPGIPDRSAPRGANAKGVVAENVDGAIIGLRMNSGGDFISGATVIGKGEKAVDVTNTKPQTRIREIIQEINPMTFEAQASEGFEGGSSGGGLFGGSFGSFASGSGGGMSAGRSGGAAAGSFNLGGSLAAGSSGMAGGDFTQMGRVAGSGGGIKTRVETNVKRVPSSSAQFTGDGVVNLESVGLGGALGSQNVRQVFTQPGGDGGGAAGGASGSFSMSGSGNNPFGMANLLGTQQHGSSFIPFLSRDTVSDFMDSFAGKKRKRRSANGRSKRTVNKKDYQALVTNCQGQNGQGPSIMVVANQGDVQFALKTDRHNDPGIVSVPAVEGWNDVTLIYDGKTLTGIVENWRGFHKASTTLTGNVDRRQAGLLVGSCQGFKSFHGEIDDLTIYKCLTPEVKALRDRIML